MCICRRPYFLIQASRACSTASNFYSRAVVMWMLSYVVGVSAGIGAGAGWAGVSLLYSRHSVSNTLLQRGAKGRSACFCWCRTGLEGIWAGVGVGDSLLYSRHSISTSLLQWGAIGRRACWAGARVRTGLAGGWAGFLAG